MERITVKTSDKLLLHDLSLLKTNDIEVREFFTKSLIEFPYETILYVITGTATFVDLLLRVLELVKKHNDKNPNKSETHIYTNKGNVEIEKLVILHQNTININIHDENERDTSNR